MNENIIYNNNDFKAFNNLTKHLSFLERFQHIDKAVNYFFENREKINTIREAFLNNKVDFSHFGYENINKFFPNLQIKEEGRKKICIVESDKVFLTRIRKLTQGDLVKAVEEIKSIRSVNVNTLIKEENAKLLTELKSEYFDFNFDIVFDRQLNKIFFIFSSIEDSAYETFDNYVDFNKYLKNFIDSRREYLYLMQDINENKKIKFKISYLPDGFLLENDKDYSEKFNFRQLKKLQKTLTEYSKD